MKSAKRCFLLEASVAAAISQGCWAQVPQQVPAAASVQAPPQAKDLDTVTVVSESASDNRQGSTAAKITVTREELARFGDTSVADTLKRLPGVTVSGSTSRGLDIRMRGLGNGYTQLLLNGEPVAAGFSIETLSPDLIDHIEVLRVPTADKSAQAVAGTINIVLKQTVRQAQKDARLTASAESGRPSASASFQLADKWDKGSYGIGVEYRHEQNSRPSVTQRTQSNSAGQVTRTWTIYSEQEEQFDAVTLTPRLNWRRDAVDSVAFDAFVHYQQLRVDWPDRYVTQVGAPPLITGVDAHTTRDQLSVRSRVNWARKLEEGAQLDVKAGHAISDRALLVEYDHLDNQGVLQRYRSIDGPARDTSLTLSGKYRAPLDGEHALSFGWDGERVRRTEHRDQRDVVPHGAFLASNLDESYDARLNRLALFVQDEWEFGQGWSLYQGLRWEEIGTQVAGTGFETAHTRSRVLSPIVQSVWKVPGTKGDQFRAGLSRTYKAPSTFDLTPRRRLTATENTPTSADTEGNAGLRPELAWGLDAAYERYFGDKALVSASLYGKQIEDVILYEIFQNTDGLWISRPTNSGKAHVLGLELELKGKLKDWLDNAPDVDVRFNAARNRSWVEAVPGPYDRLAQQIPASFNAGADWHPQASPWTVGGAFNVVRSGLVRTLDNQTLYASVKRQLEAYALYKIDAKSQVRVTGLNLLRQRQSGVNTYADANGGFSQSASTRFNPVLRVVLELKL